MKIQDNIGFRNTKYAKNMEKNSQNLSKRKNNEHSKEGERQLAELFAKYDVNKDGHLDFEQFLNHLVIGEFWISFISVDVL